jgi:hypothetical protein
MALFKSDGKLSTREEALVRFAVHCALKNAEAADRIRSASGEFGLTKDLLDDVDRIVEATRAEGAPELSLDDALRDAANSSCCSEK